MITVGKRLSDAGGISVRIVVIGAGKLGYSIAELLSNEQMDVVVVDIGKKYIGCINGSGKRSQPYYDERSRCFRV